MNQEIEDWNAALREITQQFGIGHGGIASAVVKGIDPSRIRRFDEMVDYAQRHYPNLLYTHGESVGNDPEHGLVEALKRGIQKRLKIDSEEVLDKAAEMLGDDFFVAIEAEKSGAQTGSLQEEDDEEIPFSSRLTAEVIRYFRDRQSPFQQEFTRLWLSRSSHGKHSRQTRSTSTRAVLSAAN